MFRCQKISSKFLFRYKMQSAESKIYVWIYIICFVYFFYFLLNWLNRSYSKSYKNIGNTIGFGENYWKDKYFNAVLKKDNSKLSSNIKPLTLVEIKKDESSNSKYAEEIDIKNEKILSLEKQIEILEKRIEDKNKIIDILENQNQTNNQITTPVLPAAKNKKK